MEKLGDRSQDELASDGVAESSAHSRRDFLKKAAGAALALPAAGAVVGAAAAAPRVKVGETAQPYAGVTLQFAKAPFGTDEKDVIAKLLAPFEKLTGIKVVHTIVPWNVEGATYATNYAGPNPFDVSYQTSTDLTGLGTKGVLEVLNTAKWLNAPSFASTRSKFIPNAIAKSMYQGKLYGLPCIIGGTVVYYNKDLLAKAGVTSIPTNTAQMAAAATKVMKNGGTGVWGYQTPMTDKDFNWYFQYHNIHNRGTDIISKDPSRRSPSTTAGNVAALQAAVDMILKYKAQPPVGQYDREAGVVAVPGRPDRLPRRRAAPAVGFPRGEAPVQVGLRQPDGRPGRRAVDLLDHRSLGDGLEEPEPGRRLGARQVPVVAGVRERVRLPLRLGARPQRRRHEQGRRPGQADQRLRPEGLERPPDRTEDGAADRHLRPGDRGCGDRQQVGAGGAGQGPVRRNRDPQGLTTGERRKTSEGEDVGSHDREQPGTS